MPCWYYTKPELCKTPSFRDGVDPNTERRYRREGARFILDTGVKLGLRYETYSTGVVYFHRFFMYHSFREFNRYVTATCCLFLAGKVEETPKKCKDVIKIARGMLTDKEFVPFGEDPKEEVMTLERILLQTIKFDLQVDHPYVYLLKFAKTLKGMDPHINDRNKVQKIVQMAWTFINDSLCTTLCLQWEPDIIAVALMYLASRLTKFEMLDSTGKGRVKWWEQLVEDVNQDLLEDVCHQVLDLYQSATPGDKKDESPPPPPPPKMGSSDANSHMHSNKRARQPSPSDRQPRKEAKLAHGLKQMKPVGNEIHPGMAGPSRSSPAMIKKENSEAHAAHGQHLSKTVAHHPMAGTHKPQRPHPASHPGSRTSSPAVQQRHPGYPHETNNTPLKSGSGPPPLEHPVGNTNGFTPLNPFVSSQNYSSSFMSEEGAENIQSLISNMGKSHRGGGSKRGHRQHSRGGYENYPRQDEYRGGPPNGRRSPGPMSLHPSDAPPQYHNPPPSHGGYQQPPPQQHPHAQDYNHQYQAPPPDVSSSSQAHYPPPHHQMPPQQHHHQPPPHHPHHHQQQQPPYQTQSQHPPPSHHQAGHHQQPPPPGQQQPPPQYPPPYGQPPPTSTAPPYDRGYPPSSYNPPAPAAPPQHSAYPPHHYPPPQDASSQDYGHNQQLPPHQSSQHPPPTSHLPYPQASQYPPQTAPPYNYPPPTTTQTPSSSYYSNQYGHPPPTSQPHHDYMQGRR